MEGKVYDSPFIHLFQTVSGTYFYDVNKRQVRSCSRGDL